MFSLRYCKDIVNWLFLVLWTCPVMRNQSDTIILKKNCVYMQAKNQLHPLYFYGDIAKICKLILGTLDITGHTYPK